MYHVSTEGIPRAFPELKISRIGSGNHTQPCDVRLPHSIDTAGNGCGVDVSLQTTWTSGDGEVFPEQGVETGSCTTGEHSYDAELFLNVPLLYLGPALRMVLLGKNSSEISRVENFILCRDAFNTEAPPPSVKQHSKRSGGSVEGRNITLINTPHLFDPQLSAEELNKRVRECMTLCSPGPHVLMLVLHPDDFTETDRHRLNYILLYLSEEPREHILVVTTQTLQSGSREQEQAEEIISHNIITEWSKKYFKFNRNSKACALIEMLETMVIENEWSYLQWEEYEAPTASQQYEQTTAQKESEKTEKCQKTPSVNNEEKSMKSCKYSF
ncbi:GTPase IMAP family member 9-like [Astyanax mexicanus]|uniref:GTPase IMAP family member 9-like n=1 Tax=Astyanax mexicanus TaxID=7994 RepID=UPI0020CB2DAE|nr:GTPase IMAP family member 9-like [Astyanax mexicanus]